MLVRVLGHHFGEGVAGGASSLRIKLGCLLVGALPVFVGCDALEPIPGGFPTDERLDHAVQVHASRAALDFAEAHGEQIVSRVLGTETLRFPVPPITQSVAGVNVRVCPGGNCQIAADIKGISVSAVDPSRLSLRLNLTLRGVDDAGHDVAYPLLLGPSLCIPRLGCAIHSTCSAELDTRRGSRDDVAVVATLALLADTRPARQGFTRLDIEDVSFASDGGLEGADLEAGSCDGALGGLFSGILGLLDRTIRNLVRDQVGSTLASSLEKELCTRRGSLGCPEGTFSVPDASPDAVCRFADDPDAECVPALLGLEGRTDLGALFSSISPATQGPLEFLVAASGAARVEREGLSLSFFGGARSLTKDFATSPGHAACVPLVAPPTLRHLPLLTSLADTQDRVLVRAALSEALLDVAGYAVFDSGALCLQVGSRQVPELSSSLVSLLAASLRDLTFPDRDRPMMVNLRPNAAPTFTVVVEPGPEDPLIFVDLERLEVDFYTFRDERYARFMTYSTHARIGLDLAVEGEQLKPQLASIELLDSHVQNSQTLRETPDEIASSLDDLIAGLGPTLLQNLGGFDLPEVFGVKLMVEDGTLVGVQQGDERFVTLGLSARIVTQPAKAIAMRLELASLELHPDAMVIGRLGSKANVARVRVHAASASDLHFSHRLDGGAWSVPSPARELELRQRALLFQTRHQLDVRAIDVATGTVVARSSLPITVDGLPPDAWLVPADAGVRLKAHDVISAAERLEVELDDAPSVSLPAGGLPVPPGVSRVLVRDEAGNAASYRLLSGELSPLPGAAVAPTPALAPGWTACSVRAPGSHGSSLPWPLWLALAAWLAFRQRAVGRVALAALVLAACSAAEGGEKTQQDPAPVTSSPDASATPPPPPPPPVEVFDAGSPPTPAADAGVDAGPPPPPPPAPPPLSPGTLATYLSAQSLADGSLVLAGYSPGVAPNRVYGDLVVGQRGVGSDEVRWEIVDGAPNGPVTADPSAWRGGVRASGDDVGKWSSLAVYEDAWFVAYYDDTHHALKLATRRDGRWQTLTVANAGIEGQYASLVVDAGIPRIAFASVLAPETLPGRPSSVMRIAQATEAFPDGPEKFAFHDLAREDIDCLPGACGQAGACMPSGECAAVTTACPSRCKTDEACIADACVAVAATQATDFPALVGTFSTWAKGPHGYVLAYYDALHGELRVAELTQTWGEPRVIDGRSVSGTRRGAYPSAKVAADGTLHLAYADVDAHTLHYAVVRGDDVQRSMLDDGNHRGAVVNTDGRHWVGADASLQLLSNGGVRVAYQDATAHRALLAVKAGEADFTISVLDDVDATGFWLQLVAHQSGDRLVELAYPHDQNSAAVVRVIAID